VFRHCSIFKFHEAESARLAGGSILDDFHSSGFKTLGVEPFRQCFFRLRKRDVTYKQSVQSHLQKSIASEYDNGA
jgi:hypothetical protein